MKIELEGVLLSDTQEQAGGGTLEGRSISNVRANDDRNMVMHNIPGMEGSIFQDLGRTAVKIAFDGIISGNSARNIVEMIRSKFKTGEPVAFNSDLSGAADITKVIIDDFRVADVAGNKDRYNYSITLKEFKAPPAQQTTPPAQDAEAEAWADQAAEDASGPEQTGEEADTTGEEADTTGEEADTTGEDEDAGAESESADGSSGEAPNSEKVTSGDIPPPGESAQESSGDTPPPGESAQTIREGQAPVTDSSANQEKNAKQKSGNVARAKKARPKKRDVE
jgi:hypothetical protein